MTVRICKITRAFDQFCWICGKCAADKKRQGYSIEVKAVVDWPCDVCGKPERKAGSEV